MDEESEHRFKLLTFTVIRFVQEWYWWLENKPTTPKNNNKTVRDNKMIGSFLSRKTVPSLVIASFPLKGSHSY